MTNTTLILFAEDEPLILDALTVSLEDGGYMVQQVQDGRAAIALLDGRIAEFAALITDVRLADGPDGWEVARHARALRSDIPVVYITGDSGGDWPVHGVPRSAILQKPFAPAQLVVAVSNLINDATSPLAPA